MTSHIQWGDHTAPAKPVHPFTGARRLALTRVAAGEWDRTSYNSLRWLMDNGLVVDAQGCGGDTDRYQVTDKGRDWLAGGAL